MTNQWWSGSDASEHDQPQQPRQPQDQTQAFQIQDQLTATPSRGSRGNGLMIGLGAVVLAVVGIGLLMNSARPDGGGGSILPTTTAVSSTTTAVGIAASSNGLYDFPDRALTGDYCQRVRDYEIEVVQFFRIFYDLDGEDRSRLEEDYIRFTTRALGYIYAAAPSEQQENFTSVAWIWANATSMSDIHDAFEQDQLAAHSEIEILDHMAFYCGATFE